MRTEMRTERMGKLWQMWQLVSYWLFTFVVFVGKYCANICCCTLTFLALGVVRVFSVLFFLFLTLLCLTLLTVSVMLVGVCWVAVYDTAEADMSSSPLSVALLSPTEKEDAHKSTVTLVSLSLNNSSVCKCRDIKEKYPEKLLNFIPHCVRNVKIQVSLGREARHLKLATALIIIFRVTHEHL